MAQIWSEGGGADPCSLQQVRKIGNVTALQSHSWSPSTIPSREGAFEEVKYEGMDCLTCLHVGPCTKVVYSTI